MMNTTYSYQEIKDRLEGQKRSLVEKLQDKALTEQERETLQQSIDNYQYILDLVDMNHFGRGSQ